MSTLHKFGQKSAQQKAAETRDANAKAAIEEKYGVTLELSEWNQKMVPVARDTRSTYEQQTNHKFKPILADDGRTSLERKVDAIDADLAEQAKYRRSDGSRMSREECIRVDLLEIKNRESAERAAERNKTKHLAEVKDKLAWLDSVIEAENFNRESDQRFRDKLRIARKQLETPGHCDDTYGRMESEITETLAARRMNETAGLLQESEALSSRQAEIQSRLSKLNPQPQTIETIEATQATEATQEPTSLMIDRNQNLMGQALDLGILAQRSGDADMVAQSKEAYRHAYLGQDDAARAIIETHSEPLASGE